MNAVLSAAMLPKCKYQLEWEVKPTIALKWIAHKAISSNDVIERNMLWLRKSRFLF